MVTSKKLFAVCLSGCLIGVVGFVPSSATAQNVTLLPSLTVRGEYDDNVTFSRVDEQDDYVAIISPGVTLDYASEVWSVASTVLLDIFRYADDTDLNTVNQYYSLNGDYRFTERWTLSGRGSYRKDTTLQSELEETGIVNTRRDRDRWNAGGALAYQLSEISNIGVDYLHDDVTYDARDYDDYKRDVVGVFYRRDFNSRIDTLTIRPGYYYRDSDYSEVNSYSTTFGWEHRFTERYRTLVSLGPRYTKEDVKEEGGGTDTKWGVIANLSLTRTSEISQLTVGFSNDLGTRTGRGEVNVARLYLRYDRRVVGRLGIGFDGSVYYTRSLENDPGDEDTKYLSVDPRLFYQLTDNHRLELGYSYQWQDDNTLQTDQRRDRNRVWLALNFNFPWKW